MIKSVEKTQPSDLGASKNNGTRDYFIFATLIVLILGALLGLYLYDNQTRQFGGWAKEFYIFLLD